MGTIVTVREMHTTANMFVFDLALTDFCLCTFVGPFTIAGMLFVIKY